MFGFTSACVQFRIYFAIENKQKIQTLQNLPEEIMWLSRIHLINQKCAKREAEKCLICIPCACGYIFLKPASVEGKS